MQSEANSNVYQILVHEINWKRPLRFFFFFFFFFFVLFGSGGEGFYVIQNHDLLGGI